MKRLINWKFVAVVLGIFFITMAVVPGLTTTAMAAEPAADAGAAGGKATILGLSAGTAVTGAVLSAAIIASLLALFGDDDDKPGTTPAHHGTTGHH